MSWIWGALMPHAPLLIPEIGRTTDYKVDKTMEGLQKLLVDISSLGKNMTPTDTSAAKPDCLLLLSPHHTYAQGALYINDSSRQHGNLHRFSAPNIQCTVHTEQHHVKPLAKHLQNHQVPIVVHATDSIANDHGSMVPLHHIASVLPEKKLPPVIIANPIGLTPEQAYRAGKVLGSFKDQQRWALLASGDLSHRLTRSAPGGYSPAGLIFDVAIVEALKTGSPAPLFNLSAKNLAEAGECGLRSVLMLLGLCQTALKVYSYEGSSGVGYCTALWAGKKNTAQQTPADTLQEHISNEGSNPAENTQPQSAKHEQYPAMAREAVRMFLRTEQEHSDFSTNIAIHDHVWSKKAGCFVSIKTKDGQLRGCMGTIGPTQPNLGKEIVANAITAASKDPRFPPMQHHELDSVVFSVDILGQPEPVRNLEELNHKEWGVIVTKGPNRGLLLPDIDGVNSVEQQLHIAARKAGLPTWHGASIEKFSVKRYKEQF